MKNLLDSPEQIKQNKLIKRAHSLLEEKRQREMAEAIAELTEAEESVKSKSGKIYEENVASCKTFVIENKENIKMYMNLMQEYGIELTGKQVAITAFCSSLLFIKRYWDMSEFTLRNMKLNADITSIVFEENPTILD